MNISDLFNKSNINTKMQTSTPISNYYADPPITNRYKISNRGVEVSDDDLKAIRPLVFSEVSNRAKPKKELETHVILNTALNRQKAYSDRGISKTLSEILAMPNQYQGYGKNQYQQYESPPDELSRLKKKEVDEILDKITEQLKSGVYNDTTEGAYYYIHNPDQTITYDNKRKLFK